MEYKKSKKQYSLKDVIKSNCSVTASNASSSRVISVVRGC